MCKSDLPQTYDHENKENALYQKFAFDPLIKSASSFLYFRKGGITQQLLHALKYSGQWELGETLGEWYGKELASTIHPDVIVPVPIHKSKKRVRGYNQSFHIAKGISKALGLGAVEENLVTRMNKTTSQTRKAKSDRWKNVDNIYSQPSRDLSGLSVLVVDDVITTGATVGMLCDRLGQANPELLHVVSIARGG